MVSHVGNLVAMATGTLMVEGDRLVLQPTTEGVAVGPEQTIGRDLARPIRLLPASMGVGIFVRWDAVGERWDHLFQGPWRPVLADLEAHGWSVEVLRSWRPSRRYAPPV